MPETEIKIRALLFRAIMTLTISVEPSLAALRNFVCLS